jgi:hypothetical protein
MDINLMTAKTGELASEHLDINLQDFWRTYLILLATRKGETLFNEVQIELLVFLLMGDVTVSYFEGENRKKLCRHLNVSSSQLVEISKKIVEEKMLVKPEKAKRGKWFLSPSLLNFRKFILLRKEVNFLFPLKITENGRVSGNNYN